MVCESTTTSPTKSFEAGGMKKKDLRKLEKGAHLETLCVSERKAVAFTQRPLWLSALSYRVSSGRSFLFPASRHGREREALTPPDDVGN